MSEGFECDRCGRVESGPPRVSLVIGDGRKRTRRPAAKEDQFNQLVEDGPLWEDESDLCGACWDDLREWMGQAGGEFSYTLSQTEDGDE